jgi:multiple sugar transport system substrate-binding protein
LIGAWGRTTPRSRRSTASIYIDLNGVIAPEDAGRFRAAGDQQSTVDGRLVQLPRHSDVSNLFYQKSLYEDAEKQAAFKEKYGYDLAPPETWAQVKDQAIFFSNPPDFYGFQFVGKDEAVTGRFYETAGGRRRGDVRRELEPDVQLARRG